MAASKTPTKNKRRISKEAQEILESTESTAPESAPPMTESTESAAPESTPPNMESAAPVNGADNSDMIEDVFSNLDAIRLLPEEAGMVGTEEVLVQIPVRKPKVSEFFRVSTDPNFTLATTVYEDPDGEVYFVAPELRNAMVMGGLKTKLLVLTVNQRGLCFFWPIALGDGTGRRNAWHDSAHEAMKQAKTYWTKIISDMASGQYRVFKAVEEEKLAEPNFPVGKSMKELLRIAFRGRIIDSEDHPAVKQAIGIIP